VKNLDTSALTEAITTDKVVCLYGADTMGLTALALDAVLDLAGAGQKVVYVACEGEWQLSGIMTRLGKARHLGQVKGLFVLPKAINMLKPANVDALANVIAKKVGTPSLIVLDCLAYCFGADELNPREMAAFVANLNRLQEMTASHVLLLHRTGRASVRGTRSTAVPPEGMTLVASAA
jgi:RecA-family ATPase